MTQPGPQHPPGQAPSGPWYPPQGQPPYAYPPPAPPGGGPRKRTRRWPYVLAGLVALGFVLNLLGLAPSRERARDRDPVPQSPVTAEGAPINRSAFDLQAGDCYNITEPPATSDAASPTTTRLIIFVQAVPCTSPHRYQVIAKITYAMTDPYQDIKATRAEAACQEQFEQKLSSEVRRDPTLSPGTLVPSDQESWDRNPAVACVVKSATPISRSLLP